MSSVVAQELCAADSRRTHGTTDAVCSRYRLRTLEQANATDQDSDSKYFFH
jgi:hypothetical protein